MEQDRSRGVDPFFGLGGGGQKLEEEKIVI